MTHKHKVELATYAKGPRGLTDAMLGALQTGILGPLRETVATDPELRLDIRNNCFNIYFRGGNLLQVASRKGRWEPHFALKYCSSGRNIPPVVPEWLKELPPVLDGIEATQAWADAFGDLRGVMEKWWTWNSKGERADCQAMAQANGEVSGAPASDYLIIDIEYQWAQRRFDLIAAKRNITERDANGWERPVLAFVEVKSEPGALAGGSGILAHIQDFGEITQSRELRKRPAVEEIKEEFVQVVDQKRKLGLLSEGLPFQKFADEPPEMLLVFVGPKIGDRHLARPLSQVADELKKPDPQGNLRFMELGSAGHLMRDKEALELSAFRARMAARAT